MKISRHNLYQLIHEEVLKEFEENPPWTADESAEREISHAAERESRELMKQFRGSLKRDVGRVWGDEAVERREKEAAAAAAESVIPRLMAALELPPSEERDDEVKHMVYILDNLQPGFYEPSEEELAGVYGDPTKAGLPSSRKLSGRLPSLDIELDEGKKASKSVGDPPYREQGSTESQAQQMAAGAALSARRGDTPVSKLKGASKDLYDGEITTKELRNLAKLGQKVKQHKSKEPKHRKSLPGHATPAKD